VIPPPTSPGRARHTRAGCAVLARLGVIFTVAVLAGAVLAVFGLAHAVLIGGILAGALAVFGLVGAAAAVVGADGFLVLAVAVYGVFLVGGTGLGGVVLIVVVTRGRDVLRPFSLFARVVRGSGTVLARSGLEASEEWQVMCAAAQLMPSDAGRRWLDEAVSFLAEAPPAQQYPAISSYLVTAPQVIAVTWAGDLARRARGVKRTAR